MNRSTIAGGALLGLTMIGFCGRVAAQGMSCTRDRQSSIGRSRVSSSSRCQASASPVTARSNCPWRTAVDSSLTGHAPRCRGRRALRFLVYPNRGRLSRKKTASALSAIRYAIPRGGFRRGNRREGLRDPDRKQVFLEKGIRR